MAKPVTVVFIPTCKRPDKLRELLSDLSGQDCRIIVFQDGEFPGYADLFARFPAVMVQKYAEPHGKERYWQLVNDAFQTLQRIPFTRAVFLADDHRVKPDFIERANRIYEESGADALNLSNDGRAGEAQWGIRYRGKFTGKKGTELHHTNWLDMCFIARRETFAALSWQIKPIERPWQAGKLLSSGVGKQISKRLIQTGRVIYQVEKSLIFHGPHESVMHPERKKPLIAGNILDISEKPIL